MSERPDNPYDMNSSSFDADQYLQKLLKVSWNLNEKEVKINLILKYF